MPTRPRVALLQEAHGPPPPAHPPAQRQRGAGVGPAGWRASPHAHHVPDATLTPRFA
ncbi:hypothetical protein V8C86DRAFT_3122123 [Haematococcus lacustris]